MSTKPSQKYFLPVLGLTTLVIFLWLWTWGRCADPFAVQCFINNHSFPLDYSQAFSGFSAYMKSNSFIPPVFDSLTWPYLSSVALTDSVPIASIFSKLVSTIAGNHKIFQYFSVINLVNNLAILFSIYLASRRLLLSPLTFVGLSIFCIYTPAALVRLEMHPFHANHITIIVAILFYAFSVRSLRLWALLLVISIGTSLYYAPVILLYFLCGEIGSLTCSVNRRNLSKLLRNGSRLFLRISLLAISAIFSLWMFGFLVPASRTDPDYHVWDANLLSLLNPQGNFSNHSSTSALGFQIPIDLPYEWEGNAYLGLGAFVLLLMILIHWLFHSSQLSEALDSSSLPNKIKSDNAGIIVNEKLLILPPLLLFLFAIGPEIHAGAFHLVSLRNLFPFFYDNNYSLYAYFRASGRYTWPLIYTIYLLSWLYFDRIKISYQKRKVIVYAIISVFLVEASLPVISVVKQNHRFRYSQGAEVVSFIQEMTDQFSGSLKDGDVIISNAESESDSVMKPYTLPFVSPNIKTNYRAHAGRYPSGYLLDKDLGIEQLVEKSCNLLLKNKRSFSIYTFDREKMQNNVPSLQKRC